MLQQSVSADAEQSGGMITIGDFDAEVLNPAMIKFDQRVAAGDKTITFRINSFGGSIFLGLDVIQYIGDVKRAHNIRTVCIVDNRAYSMGAAFLESDACDTRLMTPRSTLLFHNASGGAEGTSEQIAEAAQMLAALNEAMARLCSARMHVTLEFYRNKIATQAWTMAAAEAIVTGAVDGIIETSDLPTAYELAPVEPAFGF